MMVIRMFVMLFVGSYAYDDEQSTLLQASIKNHETDADTMGTNKSQLQEESCVHDSSKCDDAFNDCCGEFGHLGSCHDGYIVKEVGKCGWMGGQRSYNCCRPTCKHDHTKCRDLFDDCCGEFGNIGTCADGYTAYPVGQCGALGWQVQYECKWGCADTHTKPSKPSRPKGREGCEARCYKASGGIINNMCVNHKDKCHKCKECKSSLLQDNIENKDDDAETTVANKSQLQEEGCVHDSSKCDDAFNDCCGEFGHLGSCHDGYIVKEVGKCGWMGGQRSYNCCRPTCKHDRTKCRDMFDDCCGEFGNLGTCADGYTAYPVGTCGLMGWQQQYECKIGCSDPAPPKPSRVGREGCELKCYDRHDELKTDMCHKAKCAGCSGCASLLEASIKNHDNSTWGGAIGGAPGDRTLLCKITFYEGKDCDDGGFTPYGHSGGNKLREGAAIRMISEVDKVLYCKSNCDEGKHTDKYLENHAVAWKINYGGVGDVPGCDHIEIYDEDNPKKGYGDNVIMDRSAGTMGKTGQCNVLPDDLSEDLGGYYIKGYENR